MNSLEFHSAFIAEADSLARALARHSLVEKCPENGIGNLPEIFRDIVEIDSDDELSEKLRQHIASGVDIDQVQQGTRATAMWRCFNSGKRASMRVLIKAGAKTEWTPEQVAIALGDVPELPQSINTDLFCFACSVGNIAAARAYISKFETGLSKSSKAVTAAVKARAANVIEWLISQGFDPNAVEDFGWFALERAMYNNDVATAEALLVAGASPHGLPVSSSPVNAVATNEMLQLFIKYGANPANFEYGPSLEAPKFESLPKIEVSQSDFDTHRTSRVGRSNPEQFLPPFWSEQLRTGRYCAPDTFECGLDRERPVWTFARFGRSLTELSDGGLVFVAGEHEDHYDPNFCIYADVTVLDKDGQIAHYIYPEGVFPPTDFHSATLVNDEIWLIGTLSYPENRKYCQTQVLRLSVRDFSITPVKTHGKSPGWIHRHRAVLRSKEILITGGKIEPGYVDNPSTFSLDLNTLTWRTIE